MHLILTDIERETILARINHFNVNHAFLFKTMPANSGHFYESQVLPMIITPGNTFIDKWLCFFKLANLIYFHMQDTGMVRES